MKHEVYIINLDEHDITGTTPRRKICVQMFNHDSDMIHGTNRKI